MAQFITVRPSRSGLVVLDERGRQMPDKDQKVKRTPFVIRQIKEGDLVEVKSQVRSEPQKSTPPSKPKSKKGDDR